MKDFFSKGLKTYNRDGRMPMEKLYNSFLKLKKFGWVVENIHQQKRQGISLPILSLRTKKSGSAVWLIAGIHGEEPAGPIAIVKNIEFLAGLGEKGIPFVVLPLCNPFGYLKNWRYPNEYRRVKKGTSVGDSGHLLPDLKNPTKPRIEKPACPEAEALTSYVVKLAKIYPPILVFNLHEDEDPHDPHTYIYFYGKRGANDPLAREVVKILLQNKFLLKMKGKTKWGKVVNGVVANVKDGSIDELLSAKKIIFRGKQTPGPSAEKVVVVETPTKDIPLEKRVKAHGEVLKLVEPTVGIEPTT